jgi:prevent-host-death family protein
MKTASFTEFRKHAAEYLNGVERGEVLRILRHGKPVADLTPVLEGHTPSWKKASPRIRIKGVTLSEAILKERVESPR